MAVGTGVFRPGGRKGESDPLAVLCPSTGSSESFSHTFHPRSACLNRRTDETEPADHAWNSGTTAAWQHWPGPGCLPKRAVCRAEERGRCWSDKCEFLSKHYASHTHTHTLANADTCAAKGNSWSPPRCGGGRGGDGDSSSLRMETRPLQCC